MQVADGVIVVETRHNPALAIRTGKANISSKPYSAGGGGGQFPIFKNPNFLSKNPGFRLKNLNFLIKPGGDEEEKLSAIDRSLSDCMYIHVDD